MKAAAAANNEQHSRRRCETIAVSRYREDATACRSYAISRLVVHPIIIIAGSLAPTHAQAAATRLAASSAYLPPVPPSYHQLLERSRFYSSLAVLSFVR